MCKTTDTTFFRYFIFYDIFFNRYTHPSNKRKLHPYCGGGRGEEEGGLLRESAACLPKAWKTHPNTLAHMCVCVFVREFGKHRESKLQLLYYIYTTKQQRMIGVSVVEANDARFLFCISFIVLFLARLCVCIMPNKC